MTATNHLLEVMTEPMRGPDPDRFRTQVYKARWYQDPLPADQNWLATKDKWPAVTTIKKGWSKPFRKKLPTGETVPLDAYWAATFTVEKLDAINALADDPDAAVALICGAGGRTLNAAADRGSGVHTVLEQIAGGTDPETILVGPDVAPFVPACAAFINDWHPQWIATEFVAINRTLGFGGTGDAIIAINLPAAGRYVCITDWKSRGGQHGCYEEEVAQIGGYSLAEYIIVLAPDGRPVRVPLPPLDGGLVVSLTADGYEAYPIDLVKAQEAFKAMYESWRGHREGQKAARGARQQALMLPSTSISLNAAGGQPDGPGSLPATQQEYAALLDRTEWVRDRVQAIKDAGHAPTLAREWSRHPDIPTFPKGGPTTNHELDLVIAMCETVEKEHQLPFGVSDPTIPETAKSKRKLPA